MDWSPSVPQAENVILHDTPTASPALLEALDSHLPFSLPVLRRIQFASRFPGGSTPSTHILHAFYGDDTTPAVSTQDGPHPHPPKESHVGKENPPPERKPFAAAYVDLSRYPETQAWLYSTLEDFHPDKTAPSPSPFTPTRHPSEEEISQSDTLTLALLKRMYEISSQPYPPAPGAGSARKPQHKHTVLIGSLHETVRQRMLTMGVRMDKTGNVPPEVEWEFCNKWLFRVEELPDFAPALSLNGNGNGGSEGEHVDMELSLGRGNNGIGIGIGIGDEREKSARIKIKFDRARREDVPLIRSRTSIDRKEDTLLRLPSLVLRRVHVNPPGKEEDPIAWAFTAPDGTLMTLHVEPPYRGLGLAKFVASKIMRDHVGDYGPDGWGAADVFVQNTQSQGVCRSIGGSKWWTLSWAVVDLASVGSVV